MVGVIPDAETIEPAEALTSIMRKAFKRYKSCKKFRPSRESNTDLLSVT